MLSNRRTLVALLTLSLGTVACRAAAREESPALKPPASPLDRFAIPAELLGCYALYDHRGRPAAESLYWAPVATRLDTIPPHGAWKLDATGQRMGPEVMAREPWPTWTIDSLADTVRIEFHSGFSGTLFVLGFRRGNDTLHGHALSERDIGPPWVTDAGAATAVRVRCRE